MPTTYNGIGTHYYGKKNLSKRPAACPHCGRNVELASYDTRLWFVFLLIPVVPLRRKHIVDYCPSCTRHYAVDLEKWETAKQLEISGALDKFRSHPTPEEAIATHRQLLSFHQTAQADDFRKTMLEKFGANAKVQAYLGAALEHVGRPDEAMPYFERAVALRPDLPEARVGLARGHIRAGRLDEARKCLDFLEKPGAAQLYSLEPLEILARRYQAAGQHREALELFRALQEGLPAIAERPAFRKLVRKSERAIGATDTMLPKLKWSWRRLFQNQGTAAGPRLTARSLLVAGIILALTALGFACSNEYIRRHRTLHIVNASRQPATVLIPGVGRLEKLTGLRRVMLPEGRYHATISGPVQQEMDFEVRQKYFQRWFSDPAWVLNVGGAALLVQQDALYSRNPTPPTLSFHFGQSFEFFPRITHAFVPLPKSLQIRSGETRTLVQLDLSDAAGSEVFNYYLRDRRAADAREFAERWLRVHPEDTDLLQLYAFSAHDPAQIGRVDAYLRARLAERPVRIEWHRTYQTLHDHPDGHAGLMAQYDEWLRSEPTNSALLYLRGRIDTNRPAARDYFERAMAADGRNPFPPFALGYDRMTAGDWAGARPFLEQAVQLDTNEPGFLNGLIVTRLSLGEAAAVEQEMRKELERDPVNFFTEAYLIEALAAQDRPDSALQAGTAFQNVCRAKFGPTGQPLINAVEYHVRYAIGNFPALERAAEKDPSPFGKRSLAAALIEQDRLDEAEKVLPQEAEADQKPYFTLALAVAFQSSGNPAKAGEWRNRAIRELREGRRDYRLAAALLEQEVAPSAADLLNVPLPPRLKAVWLAELAQRFPPARAEIAGLARRLNTERQFPYYLVQRATAPLPPR